MGILILFTLFFLPAAATADPLIVDIENALKAIPKAGEIEVTLNECSDAEVTLPPYCHELTQSFCSDLWNKNFGSMDVHDGRLNFGYSEKSSLETTRIIDYRALIDSIPRLPSDFVAEAGPAILVLKALLDNEESTTAWDRKLAESQQKIDAAYEDVALARSKKSYPEIHAKRPSDRTLDETLKLNNAETLLFDEVTKAKYADHPNWKRVEKVFSQAQKDLLDEIGNMKIPEEVKKIMLERISSAKLSLPLANNDELGVERSCATTMKNAEYHPDVHTFTACAGYFNAMASETALYRVIAHEMSHSIDPSRMANIAFFRDSPLHRQLKPLAGAPAGKIPCADWAAIKSSALGNRAHIFTATKTPLDNLYSCLKPRRSLLPLSEKNIEAAAKAASTRSISAGASGISFTLLTQPKYEKYGAEIYNKFYLRPDLLFANGNGTMKKAPTERIVLSTEIFAQDLVCEKIKKGTEEISFRGDLPESVKAEFLKKSLATTEAIRTQYLKEAYQFCGQNCTDLVESKLSVDANENFSDWMAIQGLKRHLSRIPDAKDRRIAAARANSHYCDEPGTAASSRILVEEEANFSNVGHGAGPLRQNSIFSEEIAALAGCRVQPERKGFSQCKP